LINLQNKVNKFTGVINLRGVSTNNSIICFIVLRLNLQRTVRTQVTHSNSLHLQ
jgi:hypothetical protein